MDDIVVVNLTKESVNSELINDFVKAVITEIDSPDDSVVSIVVVSDEKMAELNQTYRHKSGTTDVLSFELGEERSDSINGEIFIALDEAKEIAKKNEETVEQALKLLIIHGILHLAGYDHENVSRDREKEMQETELKLRKKFDVEFTKGV